MIVVCPGCQARFQYDEGRFQGAASKRFKCPKCAHVFDVLNPNGGEEPTAPMPVAPAFTQPVVAPPTQAIPTQVVPDPLGDLPLPPRVGGDPTLASPRTTARRDREAMLRAARANPVAMPTGFRFSLAVLSGVQASTVHAIAQAMTVIGREEGDIITHDPETSRRHAQIEIHGDGTAWITDLNSTNGVMVDGRRIEEITELHDQQEFTCGNTTFMMLIRRLDAYEIH